MPEDREARLPGAKGLLWAAASAAFASGVFSRMRKVKMDCSTFWLITGALYFGGRRVFNRLSAHFADVI